MPNAQILLLMPEITWGGAERQFRFLIENSYVHDTAISVVNMHLYNTGRIDLTDEEKRLNSIDCVNIHSVYPDSKINTTVDRVKYAMRLEKNIRPLIDANNYDAVIVYEPQGCYLIPFFKRKHLKVIYSERNSGEGVVAGRLTRFFVSHSDIITCNSENAKRILEKGFNRKVHLIKNGVAVKSQSAKELRMKNSPVSEKATLAVLVPARIAPVKNQMEVIELVHTLEKVSLKVTFAGKVDDPVYLEQLKERIDKYNLTENFRFPGFVSNMDELYDSADIVLLPSFVEGMSNVLLECFIRRKMVLCSNIPMNCINEQITSHSFDPNDVQSIYKAFNWYISCDQIERDKYINANYEYVLKEHSVDGMVKKYIDLAKQ